MNRKGGIMRPGWIYLKKNVNLKGEVMAYCFGLTGNSKSRYRAYRKENPFIEHVEDYKTKNMNAAESTLKAFVVDNDMQLLGRSSEWLRAECFEDFHEKWKQVKNEWSVAAIRNRDKEKRRRIKERKGREKQLRARNWARVQFRKDKKELVETSALESPVIKVREFRQESPPKYSQPVRCKYTTERIRSIIGSKKSGGKAVRNRIKKSEKAPPVAASDKLFAIVCSSILLLFVGLLLTLACVGGAS
jgi:hypothetical protein